MENKLIPLQPLYLNLLAVTFEAEKLDTVVNERPEAPGYGVLYLVRAGTTIPEFIVEYGFENHALLLRLCSRNERSLDSKITYAEGLDGYLPELRKFLRADRLAAPAGRGLGKTGSRINPQG